MSETLTLSAESRDIIGTGGARAARRDGKLPAVIYGDGKDPQSVVLDTNAVTKAFLQGGFLSAIINVDLDGKTLQAIPKDIQKDPVKDFLLHVDLLRVGAKTRLTIEVPVHFANEEECPGLKRGGVLNVVRHEVEVRCPANAIPTEIVLDLIEADIGDSIKISDVKLPEGVKPTIADRDFTIATIAAPTIAEEETTEAEGEEGEGAEGETPTEEDAASTED